MIPLLLLFVPPQLSPATLDSPVKIENGITKIGYQTDCNDLSKLFAWRPLRKPVRNRSWIALESGSAKPGRYWVQDSAVLSYPGEPPRFPGGQIVNVLKWQGVKGWLDEPFSADIRGQAKLVAAPILTNVHLENAIGRLSICLVDGFSDKSRVVEGGWDIRALSVQNCRNGRIENAKVGPASVWGPGQGYACQVQASTSITIDALTSIEARHAGNVFGGSNVTFKDCVAVKPKADGFDAHGYGSRKTLFQNCDWGGSNFSAGNKYAFGDEVHVVGGRGIQTVYVYGGVDLWLEGVTCSMVIYNNQAGSAKAITAWDCTFGRISYVGEFTGTLSLAGCLVREAG